jgi:hypothetical protein
MTRARQAAAIGVALVLFAAITVAAPGAATRVERACFYYSNSGAGLWATKNVSCKTANHVYSDAMKRVQGGVWNRTIRVDGWRCVMHFDGGGTGHCSASHARRIHFSVP